MTRREFLNDLYRRLGDMPQEEAEQHLTYYAEMLADRMEEGMTEEEAVQSMEDVDTIAGRILRDRAEGAEPPHYPEPPLREPAAEPPRPAAPERRRNRWVLPVILVFACLTVFGALRALFGFGGSGIYIGNEGIRIGDLLTIDNSGIRIGPGGSVVSVTDHGIEVGPDGAITSVTDEGIAVGGDAVEEIPVVEGAAPEWVVSEVYGVDTKDVQKLVVNWVAGDVYMKVDREVNVNFYETSTSPLDESKTLRYTPKNGVLTIDFSEENLLNFKGKKDLTIHIPRSLVLRELQINTVSANCYVETLCERAELNSTSGDVRLAWCDDLEKVDFDSVSGDLTLELPERAGFELTFDTVSGDVDTGAFPFSQDRDGTYESGDKALEIKADTVSGDVALRAK